MSDESGRHRSREHVLEELRAASEPLRISELAERLGVHPNTVRFHLESLVRDGRVEALVAADGRPGRPATTYRPVPGMDPAGPRAYAALAAVLAEDLSSRPHVGRRATAIGRRWGHSIAQQPAGGRVVSARASRDRLRRMLDHLGFAPVPDDDPKQIPLRSCPFLELARSSTRVVCPVHLGLMRGALEAWRAPIVVDRLEAFAEPDLCLVHLGTPGGSA